MISLARLIGFVAALAAQGVAAQSLVSTGQSFVAAELRPGARAGDGSWEVGLTLTMAPGWKTYWRAPGEAGIPPRFDWAGSGNLGAVEIDWPRPVVFDSFGLTTLGYDGVVTLPIRVVPVDPSAPMALRLGLALGVCRDVCVLEETAVALDLGPATPPVAAAAIAAARAAVPGAVPGVSATCRVVGAGTERRLEALVRGAPGVPHVVVEGPPDVWISAVASEVRADGVAVRARVTTASPEAWVDRRALRLTVLGEGLAADIQGCDAPPG